nr:putative reverse transcriptase domain-containing protein [Tanacetum cinerariifolium]
MDPAKVEAITKWPRPTSVTEEREKSFEELKQRLVSAPVLTLPSRSGDFQIYNDATLREALLTEAHSSPFSVHPGSTKMYHDLKQYFWWSGMKKDVATFVARDHEIGTYGMATDYLLYHEGMSILSGRKSVPGINSRNRGKWKERLPSLHVN